MDKAYKTLFLKALKRLMQARLPGFTAVKQGEIAVSEFRDVFAGSTLYRRALAGGRCVWLLWSPADGVERSFNVSLGWSSDPQTLPLSPARDERLYSATGPVAGLVAGSIDLEQIEGKAAIGGITIPSPWDQLLLVKAAAPRAVQQAAQAKAFAEAQVLSEADRARAVDDTLSNVFDRIEARLPAFSEAVGCRKQS